MNNTSTRRGPELGDAEFGAIIQSLNERALVLIIDDKGRMIYVNTTFLEVSKYGLRDCIGQSYKILTTGEQPLSSFTDLWDVVSHGQVWRGEVQNRAKDGTIYWTDTSISPILNTRGQPEKYVLVCFVITEKKKVEGELRDSNQRLEDTKKATLNILEDLEKEGKELSEAKAKDDALLSSIGDSLVSTDRDGRITLVNKAFERAFGWKEDEIKGKIFVEVFPMLDENGKRVPISQRLLPKILKGKNDTPSSASVQYQRRDGSLFFVAITVSPIMFGGTISGAVEIVRDITREKAESAHIKAVSNRLSLATESAHIGVWELDVQKNSFTWNEQMFALYGVKREDFKNSFEILKKSIHREDKKMYDEAFVSALAGTKDIDMTFRILWPDGSIHFLRAHALVERNEKGRPIKMVGVNWDVTQEMEIDRAKSEFVSLASHQLRTPLSTIKWYAEMLMMGDAGTLSDEQHTYLQEIYRGNQRMIDLVNSLLDVSKMEIGTLGNVPALTNCLEVAHTVIRELQPLIDTKGLVFGEKRPLRLPRLLIDPSLLHAIFQNLLSNAIKYTPNNGHILLDVHPLTIGERIGGAVMTQPSLAIIVSDTGYGIPQDQQSRIFTKLFRADNIRIKDTEGNGLGLYLVKSIIGQSGGTISFISHENKGTTFYVTLPLSGKRKGA